MLHRDTLKQLIPLELGASHAADLALEGDQLDAALISGDELLLESFPDTADSLIANWERICALTPGSNDTLQQRRYKVVAKLRETGGLSRAYFIALAAAMGYTIEIEEPFATEGPHVWRITFTNIPIYEFCADESCAEELLLDWASQTAAEGLFESLKPAHSRLIIAYT